jgi:hypothetical protein
VKAVPRENHANEHRAKTKCEGFSARRILGLKALYQIHYDTQGNAPREYIANGKDPQKGSFIRVSVGLQGDVFAVSIGPDGPQRIYPVK